MLKCVLKILIPLICAQLLLLSSAFCNESKDSGVFLEKGKMGSKRVFYIFNGKKREVVLKDTQFFEPKYLSKSEDGLYIVFLDEDAGSRYDSNIYLHDIKKNKTSSLYMRNVSPAFVKHIEWFDTHSFILQVTTDTQMTFLIGERGLYTSGAFVVKFGSDYSIDSIYKLN